MVVPANTRDRGGRPDFRSKPVLATIFVFWLAHVYAGTVALLGDPHESDEPGRLRFLRPTGVRTVGSMKG